VGPGRLVIVNIYIYIQVARNYAQAYTKRVYSKVREREWVVCNYEDRREGGKMKGTEWGGVGWRVEWRGVGRSGVES